MPMVGILGIESFPADEPGFEALLGWLSSYGEIQMVGVEGTGSWGVGLSRFFHDHEISVVEVDRPNRQNRQNRRKIGKSDTTDAISAARAALSGSAWVTPKTRNGPVEQIRILLVARRSARSQRIETLNQLRHLIFTAPDTVRSRFKGRPKTGLVTEVAKLRPRKGSDPVLYTTQVTMRGHARRVQSFNAEIKSLDTMLTELVHDTAPSVVGLYGVGSDTAATLLVAAGDNPDPKCCNDPLNSHRLWAGGPNHRRRDSLELFDDSDEFQRHRCKNHEHSRHCTPHPPSIPTIDSPCCCRHCSHQEPHAPDDARQPDPIRRPSPPPEHHRDHDHRPILFRHEFSLPSRRNAAWLSALRTYSCD